MNSLWDLLSDFDELINDNLEQADQETHELKKNYFLGKTIAYIVARDAIKRILKAESWTSAIFSYGKPRPSPVGVITSVL